MKIVVYRDLVNNCILSVATTDYYKGKKRTDADMEAAVAAFNVSHPDYQYELLECNEGIYEAVRFILGEGQYRHAHSLSDIFLKLTELRDRMYSLCDKEEKILSDITGTMDDVETKIQKFNECTDIEEELERFAYSLPHAAEGHWPEGTDCMSVEARTEFGVHHTWSYEQVRKIARHFLKLEGGEK